MRTMFLLGISTFFLWSNAPGESPATFPDLPETVGWHRAVYDDDGKLLPWTTWDDALQREMAWYLNCPEDSHGYPIFVFTTFMNGLYKPYDVDIIPCTQDGMGIISYLKYWDFKGRQDARILALARKMGDYLVRETLTPDEGAYPRFTRSTGYQTDFPLRRSSQGDEQYGDNVIEPDKGGIAGYALLQLFDVTQDARYLDQAVHNAECLVKNMRPGGALSSPWPFRVDSISGRYWGERNGNMVFILRLFDALLEKGYSAFQSPRDQLWRWINTFQFNAPEGRDGSLWIQFFEDMTEEDNRTSWAPLEMARYLIEKRESLDPQWKIHAEKCIQFAIKNFGKPQPGGVMTMVEQDTDHGPWGGACSKLGGVAALFYAAGGGESYRDLAYRNLNWMTYFIREDGLVCDMASESTVREGGWQEDCHTDVIHNFVDAFRAVPEWAGPESAPRRVPRPKRLAYSASPNAYFNDHADAVARIYDGLFFVAGAWDQEATKNLGLGIGESEPVAWRDLVRDNVSQLSKAGAAENLLGVHFSDSGEWPSPETLRSAEYTAKMSTQFGAIAAAAKRLGFRGVSIDIEYPYPRYALDHAIYTYDGYTADDLTRAAEAQGRAITQAILDAFPDAVIAVLPGYIWSRPLARTFQLGMLAAMAERDATGGLHFFSERSYCLLDPVSQIALSRENDLALRALVKDERMLAYWQRRCSVAPGVWPLHRIETGGKDYPIRPWNEELAELQQQMDILSAVAKRYVWSYSGQPLWHSYAPELAEKYGLGVTPFDEASAVAAQWHNILTEPRTITDPKILYLIGAIRQYDRGAISPQTLCSIFGTPGDWMMLGPLANPWVAPQYAAPDAWNQPLRTDLPIAGRDGAVRWFVFPNYEPLGSIRVSATFDWLKTDWASAQFISTVHAKDDTNAQMQLGWDDGVAVWINSQLVFDRRAYPEKGHGLLFKDRYNFEESIPVTFPKGDSRLAVLTINQRGQWGLNIRFTDENGWPLQSLSFSAPEQK